MPSRLMKTREDIRSTSIRSESITLDAVPRAALARSGDEDTTIAANNAPPLPVVLSFDVEEHHRIEAAAGLQVDPGLQRIYGERMSQATVWTLEQLAAQGDSRDIVCRGPDRPHESQAREVDLRGRA